MALSQVIFSPNNTQSLVLGAAGNATGGSFNIGWAGKDGASNVVIPQGVTAIQDAAKLANLNITQNLTNAGILQVVSTNAAANAASISAMNIINQQSGIITSILPQGGLPGFGGALSSVGLNLNAVDTLVNNGVISSSANLSINAPSIENALPAGVAGPSPVLQAVGDLNLVASAVQNAGLISSLNSNINIASQLAQNLVVNSTGGAVQALNGVINVGNPSATDIINTTITGGDYATQHLIVNSACGDAQIHPRSLVGDVFITAGSTHVSVDVGDLTVGLLKVSGDPEMDAPGNLTVNGLQAPGQPISLIAGGDITIAPSGPGPFDFGLDSQNFSGAGGDILLIAGADFTTGGGNVTITGGTAAGGSIIFDNATYTGTGDYIRTSGTTTSGKLTMIAFEGSGGGQVSFTAPTSDPVTVFNASDITIMAPNGISMGTVVGGSILLANSTPVISGGPVVVDQASGQLLQGSFTPGAIGSGGIQLFGSGWTAVAATLHCRYEPALAVLPRALWTVRQA